MLINKLFLSFIHWLRYVKFFKNISKIFLWERLQKLHSFGIRICFILLKMLFICGFRNDKNNLLILILNIILNIKIKVNLKSVNLGNIFFTEVYVVKHGGLCLSVSEFGMVKKMTVRRWKKWMWKNETELSRNPRTKYSVRGF